MNKPRIKTWTSAAIAAYAQKHIFDNALVICDRTSWTGYECDLLVAHRSLRLVDVEVKVSRSDFKADAMKTKWWSAVPWKQRIYMHSDTLKVPGFERGHLWPDKIWKHYFILPREIWDDKLLQFCSSASGVIVVFFSPHGWPQHEVIRRAKPCRAAGKITAAQCLDIARLCSIRLWQAYAQRDAHGMAGAADAGAASD